MADFPAEITSPFSRDVRIPAGFRLETHGATGSTNVLCLEAAQKGDSGNLWIAADSQTAGKGSRGRGWQSESGNLYASLLLVDPAEAEELPTLAFVACLAIRDAVVDQIRKANAITLKWPNDVLLNGRKMCGILLENHMVRLGGDGEKRAVIIGMGINVAHSPQNTLYPATSLAAEGFRVDRADLFEALAVFFAARLDQWAGGRNFATIRDDWLSHAAKLGKTITARIPAGGEMVEYSGVFRDIDTDGQLVLEMRDGSRQKLSVADIFFA